MNIVGEFYKVSYENFEDAMKETLSEEGYTLLDNFETKSIKEIYDEIQLPTRSTVGSAGHDFKSPFGFCVSPGCTIKVPTGIRVEIADGWWLGALPRSSMGFKYRMQIDNTLGVIDSDYFHSDNEGHIFMKVTNDSKKDKNLVVKRGEGFIQGIFIPYGITRSDSVSTIRNGGLGSTSR